MNFYYDFLAPAQFRRYFPFVDVIRGYPGPRPEGYAGAEDPYGLLPNMPFCWLALAAPAVWIARFRRRARIGSWLGLFGACFLALAGIVTCFFSTANRYLVDFIPSLQLVAALGLLMLFSREAWPRRTGRWLRALALAAVAYTAWFNVFAGFAHNGMFEAPGPALIGPWPAGSTPR